MAEDEDARESATIELSGTPVDAGEVAAFQETLLALQQVAQWQPLHPARAYAVGAAALPAADASGAPQMRAELLRRLGGLALELGRFQEAGSHFADFKEWAEAEGNPALALLAEWYLLLALRDSARVGLSVDGIAPMQMAALTLERMKQLHEESRNYLDDPRGRFVFVASVVDRAALLQLLPEPDEIAACLSAFDAARQMIADHPQELGHLETIALRWHGSLHGMAGQWEQGAPLLEAAAARADPGNIPEFGQTLAALGGASLRTGRYAEARDALAGALKAARMIQAGIGGQGARIQFGDQIYEVARNWIAATFAQMDRSPPEERAALLRETIPEMERASNPELSAFLLGRYAAHSDAPDIGMADVLAHLARYEERAQQPAYFGYLLADRFGTRCVRVDAAGRLVTYAPLPITQGDWAELRGRLGATFAPIAREGNPARPQDRKGYADCVADWEQAGRALAEHIFADMEAGSHLYLCSDPVMEPLPLLAAPCADGWVADRFTVCQIPSAIGMLALASPALLRREQEWACLGTGTQRDYDRRAGNPAALAAFHAVGDYVQAQGAVAEAENSRWEASSVARFAAALQAARRAFVTCHGVFNPERGLESGLFLARDGQLPGWEQPTLSAQELAELDLGTDFLGLNACVIGLSRLRGWGDGLGLSRALYQAGVRTHTAALWPVYLKAGNHFFCRLFDALRGGEALYARAFQSALIATRAAFPHLYHWAPFTLRGVGLPTMEPTGKEENANA